MKVAFMICKKSLENFDVNSPALSLCKRVMQGISPR